MQARADEVLKWVLERAGASRLEVGHPAAKKMKTETKKKTKTKKKSRHAGSFKTHEYVYACWDADYKNKTCKNEGIQCISHVWFKRAENACPEAMSVPQNASQEDLLDAVLKHAEKSDVWVDWHSNTYLLSRHVLVHKGETLESLLVQLDMRV